jgi:hypothetical protein
VYVCFPPVIPEFDRQFKNIFFIDLNFLLYLPDLLTGNRKPGDDR